jgi:hypothetical protein
MLKSELIALLNTLETDVDILTPVADKGFSGEYKLSQKVVINDAAGKAPGLPPYTSAEVGAVGSVTKYVLDCFWSIDYDYEERIRQI